MFMSFFDIILSGCIINCFSCDIEIIDIVLLGIVV